MAFKKKADSMYDFSDENTVNLEEYQQFKITQSEGITGTFEGVATEPWACILIDDGGAKYFVNASYKLREFFRKTKLPIGCVVKITSSGKIDVGGGRTMNVMKVAVAKNTLPDEYDKNLLKVNSGLDPAAMSPGDWDSVEVASTDQRSLDLKDTPTENSDDEPF